MPIDRVVLESRLRPASRRLFARQCVGDAVGWVGRAMAPTYGTIVTGK